MPNPLDHSEKAVLLEKKRVSDGMGGYLTTWTEGADFDALIMLDSSMEARVAEKQGVIDLYTIMVAKSFPLESGDYFKRISDGQVFRVTSSPNEDATPTISSMDVKAFSAAKSALPTG